MFVAEDATELLGLDPLPDLPSMFLYFCVFALAGSCNFCEGINCSVLCLFQMRDLKAVGKKFVHVMYPRKSSALPGTVRAEAFVISRGCFAFRGEAKSSGTGIQEC